MICKNCKEQISENYRKCPKCGKPLPHPKRGLFIALGIVVALFIIAVGIVIGILLGKSGEDGSYKTKKENSVSVSDNLIFGSVVGTWKFADIEVSDTEGVSEEEAEMTVSFIKAMFASMEFKFEEDRTFEMSALGESEKGKWKKDGDKIVLTSDGNGEEMKMTLKGKKLIMEEEGMKIIFEKK